ncbi:MAG: MEDS domain-containing protein [Desulfobacterales bacterium]|nr:MEDS domain-containing protein [Desulfobacterales bacterium]
MYPINSTISLGFTNDKTPAGTHICQIFSDDDERSEALLKFLASGLADGERAACFSEKVTEQTIRGFFTDHGLSYERLSGSGAFSLSGAREVYFEGNRFDPDRMLTILTRYYQESLSMGFNGARVIGEMSPEVQQVPGGERLLEYESRVSLLLKTHPVTSVCQYDARAFDGATIMDILKVHPLMVVRGSVIRNPFFIPPEEFLA